MFHVHWRRLTASVFEVDFDAGAHWNTTRRLSAQINPLGLFDRYGNLAVISTDHIMYDTHRPKGQIFAPRRINQSSFVVTFDFDEPVYGISIRDLNYDNIRLLSTQVSTLRPTRFSVAMQLDGSGLPAFIYLVPDVMTDRVGNRIEVVSHQIVQDMRRPQVSLSAPSYINHGTHQLQVRYDEPVQISALMDFDLTWTQPSSLALSVLRVSTAGAYLQRQGDQWLSFSTGIDVFFNVGSRAAQTALIGVRYEANRRRDEALNYNLGSKTHWFTYDNEPPEVVFQLPSTVNDSGGYGVLSVREAIVLDRALTAADFKVVSGRISTVIAQSTQRWRLEFLPSISAGTMGIQLLAGRFKDRANNLNLASAMMRVEVDARLPWIGVVQASTLSETNKAYQLYVDAGLLGDHLRVVLSDGLQRSTVLTTIISTHRQVVRFSAAQISPLRNGDLQLSISVLGKNQQRHLNTTVRKAWGIPTVTSMGSSPINLASINQAYRLLIGYANVALDDVVRYRFRDRLGQLVSGHTTVSSSQPWLSVSGDLLRVLSDGLIHFELEVSDRLGRVGRMSRSLIKDVQLPILSYESTLAAVSKAVLTQVVFATTASDISGVKVLYGEHVKANGRALKERIVGPPFKHHFVAGTHEIRWYAEDLQGNLGHSNQLQRLYMLPQLNFANSQSVNLTQGTRVIEIPLLINGVLPRASSQVPEVVLKYQRIGSTLTRMFPWQTPYEFSTLPAQGEVRLRDQQRRGVIRFNLTTTTIGRGTTFGVALMATNRAPYAQETEAIHLDSQALILGSQSQHEVRFIHGSYPPIPTQMSFYRLRSSTQRLGLQLAQGDLAIQNQSLLQVSQLEIGGDARLRVEVLIEDFDRSDDYVYRIHVEPLSSLFDRPQISTPTLYHYAQMGYAGVSWTLDFSGLLTPQSYRVTAYAKVQTGYQEYKIEGLIKLIRPLSLSANMDSDGDGLNDLQEGLGDSDGDGIADYLDADQSNNQALPIQATTNKTYLQVGSNQRLQLGEYAQLSLNARDVELDQVERQALGIGVDGSSSEVLLVMDYRVLNLGLSGESTGNSAVLLVQLSQPLPRHYYFRKYQRGVWSDFHFGEGDEIRAAALQEGVCPSLLMKHYAEVLSVSGEPSRDDLFCLYLKIQDGGLNDADGVVNGQVVDPFALAIKKQPLPKVAPNKAVASSTGADNKKGCALGLGQYHTVDPSLLLMLMLSLLFIWQRYRRRRYKSRRYSDQRHA